MLERLYNLPSAGGGGGGSNDNNNNRGGGDDNGDKSGKRVITEAEKYTLKGLFAEKVAMEIYEFFSGSDDPLTEMDRINDVRSYIESPKMPFKMCYDLDYKSLNFYLIPTDDGTLIDLIDTFKDTISIEVSKERLMYNMIKDVKYIGTLNT